MINGKCITFHDSDGIDDTSNSTDPDPNYFLSEKNNL